MISTILLLPHETTRGRLLAPGAPMHDKVTQDDGWTVPGGYVQGSARTSGYVYPLDGDTCLVLARSGAVVPEGVDRLCRVEREAQPANGWWATHDLEVALRNIMAGTAPNPVPPEAFPLGTLLLLDSEGNPC